VFIEVHHGEIKILVSVERISYMYNAGEKTTIVFCGDKWITADESYEEIVRKIAEGERVVAEKCQKGQEKWPHWSDGLIEYHKREAEKLMEELLDDE
jgi:hypothetical protein